MVTGVVTRLMAYPIYNGDQFANELSQIVLDGHEVLSSGFDGTESVWWAIVLERKYS